jgi:MULE transposase domain
MAEAPSSPSEFFDALNDFDEPVRTLREPLEAISEPSEGIDASAAPLEYYEGFEVEDSGPDSGDEVNLDNLDVSEDDEPEFLGANQLRRLLPPPKEVYETLEIAMAKLQAHARGQGYAITIGHSYKDKKGKGSCFKATLQCDRGGQSKALNPLKSGRNRTRIQDIRPIKCPFGATLRRFPATISGDEWRLSIDDASHNHEPSESDSAHPVHRKADRTPEIMSIVEDCLDRAVTAVDTAVILQNRYPAANITRQDIYNIRKNIYRKLLRGRSPIQALLETLRNDGHWDMNFKSDPYTNRVIALWFSLKLNHELLLHNRDGLIIDSTYKTNQYSMPLVDVIGHTSIGTSFFVGFAFIESEDMPTYIWVLEQVKAVYDKGRIWHPDVIATDGDEALIGAIKQVFPTPHTRHLLCVWHVNKAVTAKCKSAFRGKDESEWQLFQKYWTAVLYAPNLIAYTAALSTMKDKYRKDFQPQLDYIEKQWLGEHAEALLAMHTNRIRHFGLTVTSRAEGAHAAIKRALKVSTGGLLQVVERIRTKLLSDYEEYNRKIHALKYRTNPLLFGSFYAEVRGKIAPNALELIRKERDKLQHNKLSPFCSDYLIATMGIPCGHLLQGISQLLPYDIHPHWHYRRSHNVLADTPWYPCEEDEDALNGELHESEHSTEDHEKGINDPIYDVEPPRDQRRTKNLPARKKGQPKQSTMRALSAFERVEKELAAAEPGPSRRPKRRAKAQGKVQGKAFKGSNANERATIQESSPDLQYLQVQAHAAVQITNDTAAAAAAATHQSDEEKDPENDWADQMWTERSKETKEEWVNQIWARMNA